MGQNLGFKRWISTCLAQIAQPAVKGGQGLVLRVCPTPYNPKAGVQALL